MEISSETNSIRSIILRFYPSWSAHRKLRADVIRAAADIMRCRTEQLGSHFESCDCGQLANIEFNSCRHRSCPQCRGGRRADWLQKTTADLLPCDHAHIIFTVPEQFNVLWQFNRELFADMLMTAASGVARTIARRSKISRCKAGHHFGVAHMGTQPVHSSARALSRDRWRCGCRGTLHQIAAFDFVAVSSSARQVSRQAV